MYGKSGLKQDLASMGITSGDTLLVHASMKSIGPVEGGADTVLDALSETLRDGLLCLPAHTWSNINAENPLLEQDKTPVCVGVLPELFRKRPGVFRTLHPTHSLSLLGRDAAAFGAGEEKKETPCAPDSCYGRLARRGAKVLLIGVDFSRNTLLHCVEEIADVPGRITESYEPLMVRTAQGTVFSVPSRRHIGSVSENYVVLEPVLRHRGILRDVHFGGARCMLCEVRPMFDAALELLGKNIRLFNDRTPVPRAWY